MSRSAPALPPATALVHLLMENLDLSGSTAIDATCGNGYDTVFLARAVGPAGRVHGFDIQEKALRETRERLVSHECADRVQLHRQCHSQLGEFVADGSVSVVVFNLGYLPRGNKQIITRPETTVAALTRSREALRPGGLLTVVAYPGHPGGDEEARVITDYLASWPREDFRIARYEFLNRNDAPFALVVAKEG